MKTYIWFVFILIVSTGCHTRPPYIENTDPPTTGDYGTYMRIAYSKGDIYIEALYTRDSVCFSRGYDIRYSKKENKYHKLTLVFTGDDIYPRKYRKIGENVDGATRPFYSSENFIRENEQWNDFFDFLSPNFKNTNNDGRVKILDSLAEVYKWRLF